MFNQCVEEAYLAHVFSKYLDLSRSSSFQGYESEETYEQQLLHSCS